jgi:hypothetical protein
MQMTANFVVNKVLRLITTVQQASKIDLTYVLNAYMGNLPQGVSHLLVAISTNCNPDGAHLKCKRMAKLSISPDRRGNFIRWNFLLESSCGQPPWSDAIHLPTPLAPIHHVLEFDSGLGQSGISHS